MAKGGLLKKILIVLAVIVVIGVFAGGGSDKDSVSSSSSAAPAQQEQAADEGSDEGATESAESIEVAEPEPEPEPEPENEEYAVSIAGVKLAKDYEGKDCAVVTYTFTNNSDDTISFASVFYPKVFQNGIECDSAITLDGIENDNYLTDIRPGATIDVDMAYELQDMSDIEIEVKELISWDDKIYAEGTYSLS